MQAQVVHLLQVAASGAGNHKQAADQLKQYASTATEFFTVCAQLMQDASADPLIRMQAGLQMKNNMRNPLCTSNPAVQQCAMQCIADVAPPVRRAAGAMVCQAVALGLWPGKDIAGFLAQGLGQPASVEGCAACVKWLLEESAGALDAVSGCAPLVPAVVALMAQGTADKVRSDAFIAMVYLLEQVAAAPAGSTAAAVKPHVPTLLGHAGSIIITTAPPALMANAIRCVHQSFVFWETLAPMFDGITQQIAAKAADPSPEVRTEVVEFWTAVLGVPAFVQRTMPMLPGVIKYLVQCMHYDQTEMAMLQASENDWAEEDKPDAVRPKAFQHRRATDVDDGDDDEVEQWNLRRCAQLCLQEIARTHGDTVVNDVMASVMAMMQSTNWLDQEAGIKAAGSIAEGCAAGLGAHMPNLITALIGMVENDATQFLVRCTAMWALAEFGEWLSESETSSSQNFFARSAQAVAKRLFSPTKKVQQEAVTALTGLFSYAQGGELNGIAVEVFTQIEQCFKHYKLKSKYLLFELVDTLCASCGNRLAQDDVLTLVMNPIIGLWATIADNDVLIFPYFMALAGVCLAVGNAIQPVAHQLFTRSLALCHTYMTARVQAGQSAQPMPEDSDHFLIAGLDLLAGVAAALEGGLAPFITEVGAANFIQLIKTCGQDPFIPVRVSAFGVIGELCSHCCTFVQMNFAEFGGIMHQALAMPTSLEALDDHKGLVSNTAWALAQFTLNQIEGEGLVTLQPAYFDAFFRLLVPYLTVVPFDPDQRNMFNNVALCMGKMLLFDPSATARLADVPLPSWLLQWASVMRSVDNHNDGKEPAVRGVVEQLKALPAAAAQAPVLDLFGSMPSNMAAQLRADIAAICGQAKAQAAPQWAAAMGTYSSVVAQKFFQMYGVGP